MTRAIAEQAFNTYQEEILLTCGGWKSGDSAASNEMTIVT